MWLVKTIRIFLKETPRTPTNPFFINMPYYTRHGMRLCYKVNLRRWGNIKDTKGEWLYYILVFMCMEFILLQQYFYHKYFFTQTALVGMPHRFETSESEYWISQGSSEQLEMFTANETWLENLSRIKVEMWTREKSESAAIYIFVSSSYWGKLCSQQKSCFLLWSGSQIKQFCISETVTLQTKF